MELNLPKLEHLDLYGNDLSGLTSDELKQFLAQFQNLKYLNLHACRLSLEHIQALRALNLPKLKHLYFYGKDLSGPENSLEKSVSKTNFANCQRSLQTDTNTLEDPSKTFTTTQYFKGWDPADYRLTVYNTDPRTNFFQLTEVSLSPFEKRSNLPTIDEYLSASSYNCKTGEILLQGEDWNRLPSLDPQEELLALSVPEGISYELAYDAHTHFYLVKPLANGQIPCRFLLKLPHTNSDTASVVRTGQSKNELNTQSFDSFLQSCQHTVENKGIKELIKQLSTYFNAFGSGELQGISNDNSEEKILEAITVQQKGSCRHRAHAFCYILWRLQKNHAIDIPLVRLIQNDCHEYVEIQLSGTWEKIDLGGFSSAQLKTTPPLNPDTRLQLCLAPKKQEKPYEGNFAVWTLNSISYSELNPLALQKKTLFLVDTPQDAEQLYWNLYHQMLQSSAADACCYGIHDPDDMKLIGSLQVQQNGSYTIVPGPFAAFLQKQQQNPALLIRWAGFKNQEITAAQSCMDDPNPKIGSTPILNTSILGIMTTSQWNNMDDSFRSRVGASNAVRVISIPKDPHFPSEPAEPVATCPFRHPESEDPEQLIHDASTSELPINLYHTFDKAQLIGKTMLTEQGWTFVPGILAQCCEEKCSHITLINPPKDPEFQAFCRKIQTERSVWFNGSAHPLPEEFQISVQEKPYDLKAISVNVVDPRSVPKDALVINAASFRSLFNRNEFKNERCYTRKGWIEANKNKTLSLVVTESLTDDQWARLCDTAQACNCQLTLSVYSQVQLPSQVTRNSSTQDESNAKDLQASASILMAEDPWAYALQLQARRAESSLIPITVDTDYTDLIARVEIDLKNKTVTHRECFLLEALKRGEDILLAGDISLLLFSKLETLFAPVPCLWVNNTKVFFPKARIRFVTANRSFNSRVWSVIGLNLESQQSGNDGMDLDSRFRGNDGKLRGNDGGLRGNDGGLDAEVFETARIKAVTTALNKHPVIFIEGKTAVGKSYFIKNVLPKHIQNLTVRDGFESIQDWASDTTSNTTKILFIDEANLQDPKQLSQLLGIYGRPSGISIDGQFHTLTSQHKIVLAGNPASYQGRHLPPYFDSFKMHILPFSDLPECYLRHKVLDSIWKIASQNNNEISKNIDKQVLFDRLISLYQKANSSSQQITARNLQMMLLHALTQPSSAHSSPALTLFGNSNSKTTQSLATYVACLEIFGQLPQEQRQCFQQQLTTEEKRAFHSRKTLAIKASQDSQHSMQTKGFVTTDCYYEALLQLDKLLQIRTLKQKCPDLNKFGYQGITIEGLPGIGKTEFVKHYLDARGEDYLQLNPSNLSELQKILRTCIRKGKILLIDEANLVMPLLEKELNEVLQGESKGKTTQLLLIGTQNPPLYSGRLSASDAYSNRHITVHMEPSQQDLKNILKEKYPQNEMLEDYLKARRYATENNLPSPNPRDLFEQCDRSLSCSLVPRP
ncbi:MAG: hypothetical protein KKH85_11005 [Proteobacteria bacterium]|nr:hypothetical protein [Pseudomonadota bacterium]